MNTLTDAVAGIGHALERGGNNLDLFCGYTAADDIPEFVVIVSEDIPCDDALGPVGGPTQIAFAEAPTFEDALVLLAARLAESGYGAVTVP